MKKVFISGSRAISRLNDEIKERIENITDQSLEVILGDANGADKAVQTFLSDRQYSKVRVYCSGGRCRNNVGRWVTQNVEVRPGIRGRAFYTAKDKNMAADADYGFVLWDGKSPGSIENVIELLKRGKNALVYFSPTKKFHTVKDTNALKELLAQCDMDSLAQIDQKIGLEKSIDQLDSEQQETLTF